MAEVYSALRTDAKNLITDLQGGVRMWVRNSIAMILIAVGATQSLWYWVPNASWTNPWFAIPALIFLGSGFGFASYYYWHARILRKKYARLFDAAKKLK